MGFQSPDQPAHLGSLIRVFAVCLKNHWLMMKTGMSLGISPDYIDTLAVLGLPCSHMTQGSFPT